MWNDFTFLDFLGVVGSLMICAGKLMKSGNCMPGMWLMVTVR